MRNRKGDGGGQIRQCASDFVVAERFLCETLGLKDLYEHPTTMSNLIRSHILSRARKLFLFFFFFDLCPFLLCQGQLALSRSESEYGQRC